MNAGLPEKWTGLRLLAFVPHPDDEGYAFGGLLALAADEGAEITVVCASDGERGERHDGGASAPGPLRAARRAELAASALLLGVTRLDFWGLPDGDLLSYRDGPARVRRAIAVHRPDVVLAQGPDGVYGHPDHLAVYRWVTEAHRSLQPSRPALVLAAFAPGLFLPQYEKCVAAGIMGDPPLLKPEDVGQALDGLERVDVRPFRALKLAAIACHRSQLPGGDPHALFPPGIVERLLEAEYYDVVE